MAIAVASVAIVQLWGSGAIASTMVIDLPPLPSPLRSVTASAQPSVAPSPAAPGRTFHVCPVDRPRHYVDDFGDARYVGGFHRHQGIDIFAPRGTPIRAPFAGKTKSSVSWAGGLQLYVYGKRGFVFNGHLSGAARDGKVRAGDVVGWVGNSGDARGGSTHDHFEWHPGGGAAVDSFRLLNQACSGRAPRPARTTDPPARKII